MTAKLETPCNLKLRRENLLNEEPGNGGRNPPYWQLIATWPWTINKRLSYSQSNSTILHAMGKSHHHFLLFSELPLLSGCPHCWPYTLAFACSALAQALPSLWNTFPSPTPECSNTTLPSRLNWQDFTKLESSWVLSVWNNLILQLVSHSTCDEIWFFLSHILVIWSIFNGTSFHYSVSYWKAHSAPGSSLNSLSFLAHAQKAYRSCPRTHNSLVIVLVTGSYFILIWGQSPRKLIKLVHANNSMSCDKENFTNIFKTLRYINDYFWKRQLKKSPTFYCLVELSSGEKIRHIWMLSLKNQAGVPGVGRESGFCVYS